MIRFVYIFLFTSLFCLLELALRSFGLSFPFCALFVFYVSIAFGTKWGVATGCLGALALDFIGAGAAHPWSILSFAAVAYLASWWLHRVEWKSILLNFLPGAAIPVLVWFLSAIFFSDHFFATLRLQFPGLFPAAVLSAAWLPAMIFLLDNLNEQFALPLYTDAKLQLKIHD